LSETIDITVCPFIGIAYPIIWQVIDSAVSIVLLGLTSLIVVVVVVLPC